MSGDATTQVPFPEVSGETDRQHLAVAPDGTRYAVPSGTHERLRRVVVSTAARRREDGETGVVVDTDRERVASEPDPKVALALAGWPCSRRTA
ncbi:MAG: hypothetical protein ABEI99_02805 [Halobaculum sp.]